MKHFQHFPERGLLVAKVAAFARDSFRPGFFPRKIEPGKKDTSIKETLKFPQVALAYSVHVGEKIAHS